MALSLLQSNLKLDDNEYCYNTVKPIVNAGQTMKMYMPKLMSEIGFGSPRTIPISFNPNSIFCNDKLCPHNSGSRLTSQNYLEFELLHNVCSWSHLLDSPTTVPLHTKFICSLMNKNVDRRYFTTNK